MACSTRAFGRRSAAHADCLLQRGQHAPGEGHGPRARDDGPRGARRRPVAHRPAVAGRERAAVIVWSRRWLPARVLGHRGARCASCPPESAAGEVEFGLDKLRRSPSVSASPCCRRCCSALRRRFTVRAGIWCRASRATAKASQAGVERCRNALVAAEIAISLRVAARGRAADAKLHLAGPSRSRVRPAQHPGCVCRVCSRRLRHSDRQAAVLRGGTSAHQLASRCGGRRRDVEHSLRSWEATRARSRYQALPATIVPPYSSSSALTGISGPSVCGCCAVGNCPAWLPGRNPGRQWSIERSSPAFSGLRIPSENRSG